jgi:plasmid replication initiation protein
MTNDVVKYHNDLNTVVMRKWTSEEMNLFFSIISKSRDEGTKLMKFNADELRDIASKDLHLDRWSQTMRSVADKVVDLKYYERTKHSYSVMNLFSYFSVDERNRTIEVEVSSKFEYIINKLEVQFTKYELKEFTSIRSTYAKTAYRLLKQWRTVGHKEFSIDEFKLLLDMPASYKSSEIDRAVIKPILKQLSPYFEGLKVKKIKSNKRGNPVLGYEFIWNPEMTESYVPNKFNKPKHKQKSKSNVPSWSNADYVNTTSEEKKVELERKKQEMLARLDNEPPRILPGQMDMFEE